ncbi:MAG: hypothetical protein H6661_10835 [Ardenticatenaceae bacterium]|nr:hypothetical protein [Ardenticatenaceae bacterium]
MSTTNRQEILDLLASGKISATEAAEMLSAVSAAPEEPEKPLKVEVLDEQQAAAPKTTRPSSPNGLRWFHVKVRDLESGKNKVTVNIPLPVVKFGLKVGRRFSPELDELDWDELSGTMEQNNLGMLVDVEDEESNEHVQIYID